VRTNLTIFSSNLISMTNYIIKDTNITVREIYNIIENNNSLSLSRVVISKVNKSRLYLEKKISESNTPFYGVNTGFGDLHNIQIKNDDLATLQSNLIKSHACGTGKKVDSKIVRIMILLKIISLCKGYSGVRLKTINRLIFFYNNNICPVVYQYGSLGASGDLSPLSHMSLPLIGEGELEFKGEIIKASQIFSIFSLEKLKLESKEGLALINGTQFMLSSLLNSLFDSYRLSYMADRISSISLDAYNCDISPFDELISKIRPHKGQVDVSFRILDFIKGGDILTRIKYEVQDPYSFRCIPQVHGATLDTINYCKKVIETEINSATDNPLIFSDEDKIISGGNFHGQPLALVIDFLKISISELGNISERRTFNLMSGKRNLPSFLTKNPGLNSGLMIIQYTAASLVSANKQFATPASVDSITSSNGQEDHVSMGANGANQLREIITNLYDILSIELISASQAISFNNYKLSKSNTNFINELRKVSPIISNDKIMYKEIKKVRKYIENQKIKNLIF